MDSIAIIDFGSQYSQLTARRVREAHVYCELFPHDAPPDQVLALDPKGISRSGCPNSVYDPGAPELPAYVLQTGVPVLGICYGMQLLAQALGGKVEASNRREYGRASLTITQTDSPLFQQAISQRPSATGHLPHLPRSQVPGSAIRDLPHLPRMHVPGSALSVWMSHGDRVTLVPPGFAVTAASAGCAIAAMADESRGIYALQFHPEVNHTERGREILDAFLQVTGAERTWTPASVIAEAVARVQAQVGDGKVIAGVSGGVDSSVAAALVQQAVGDRLMCIFVDHGLLRIGEADEVVQTFRQRLGAKLIAVNAVEEFLEALAGVTDPEQKRRIIGEKFIRTFEREARRLGEARFLVQGTIYPDVVESAGPGRRQAARIKTHHNVGGLPQDMRFELVEPLRYLFKDEVRAVGLELGLPETMVWRQPFPGPGLAVRCLGEITWERLETLRAADAIVTGELGATGMLRGETAQAFAVLLPVRSVGVMGDGRTYAETVAVRAVTTDDFMTADWAHLPYDLLARISNRIVNEVPGVNRVVYDISSKPPATIEWE